MPVLRRDEFFAAWRASLGARVDRWRQFISRNEALIDCHPNRDRPLPEWERNARTEEFADRMREQIEKKTRKIAELEARNEQLETKIASIEKRLC